MRLMPSPAATATTAVVTGSWMWGGSSSGLARRLADPALLATCSIRSVTRIWRGRPASMAASTAAPMSSVWMWQFQMPSPPTTTIESPMPAHTSLKCEDGVVVGLEEVHDLVAQTVAVAVLVAGVLHHVGVGPHRALAVPGLGQAPVDDVQRRVEEQHEPGAAGIDHPGLGEHRQHLGRVVERAGGRRERPRATTRSGALALGGTASAASATPARR